MLSQAELNAVLWNSACMMRSSVPLSDYKEFVVPLLFLKWLSDTAVETTEQGLPSTGAPHHLVVPPSLNWDALRLSAGDAAEVLPWLFAGLEAANPLIPSGTLSTVDWRGRDRVDDSTLRSLIGAVDALDLSVGNVPPSMLADGYEFMLKKFADLSGSKQGQFFTAREVARLAVLLADVQDGDSVYDPTCGTGGMLVEASTVVKERFGERASVACFGQDSMRLMASIANINMLLHGVERFQVCRGDTLVRPEFLDDTSSGLRTFDVVLANPPFSELNRAHEVWADDKFGRGRWGVGPKRPAEWAFIAHVAASLKPGSGRAAVVVPSGALFRSRSEADVRREMLRDGLIEGIVALPGKLFYNTGITSSLMVLRSCPRPDLAGRFVVYDARDFSAPLPRLNRHMLGNVGRVVDGWRTLDDSRVTVVDHADIEANGWDLSPGLYLPAADVWEPTPVVEAAERVVEAQRRFSVASEAFQHLLADVRGDES